MGSESIDAVMVSKSNTSSSSGKCFPPGFRFHPTDEELVLYYLKRKICRRSLQLNIIAEVDVYKWDPEELPGQSKLKTGDRQWYFFSPRDRKYPNGGKSSRGTMNGYWKVTGKDRIVKRKSTSVGIKKTLVYYHGRAPSGLRTDWVMHEYSMDEQELKRCPVDQENYVLSKIFKKSGRGPKNGEEYGAPFVEEEWNDKDCLDADSLLVQKPNPGPLNEFEETGLSNDIIELLNKIIDEPDILPPDPEILEKNGTFSLEGSSSQVEKDFLELDDLLDPDTRVCNPVTDYNTFSDLDFYHEFGTGQMGNLEYGPGPGPENLGRVSEAVDRDHELHDDLSVSYNLWTHEPVSSSGLVVEENTANHEFYDSDSWFSSALWDFVDSIPTTPASASESSALVNKAFERMSSFSRGRNVNLAVAATTKRLGKPKPKPSTSSRGIVYFVLFAILWVFVGSSIDLLKRFLWLR